VDSVAQERMDTPIFDNIDSTAKRFLQVRNQPTREEGARFQSSLDQ
jgi:hypothetical protein